MEDNDSPDSKLTESQPPSFNNTLSNLRHASNSIISFTLLWKDMERHLESKNKEIEARYEKVREKENCVCVGLELIEKQRLELGSVKKSSEERLKEEGFAERLNLDREFEELRVREKEIEETRKGLELKEREVERYRENVCEGLRLKENEVEARRKGFELKERECGKKLEELEGLKQRVLEVLKLKEREVEECQEGVGLKESVLNDLRLKESRIEKKRKDLELKEKYLEERFSVLRSNEMEFEKRNGGVLEQLRVKENELDEKQKELEVKEIECEKKWEQLERSKQVAYDELKLKEKEFEARGKEIELKEMQCKKLERLKRLKKSILKIRKNYEKQRKDIELAKKDLEEQFSTLRRNKMEIEKRSIELELKDKQLEERSRDVDIKEKKVGAIFNAPLLKESLDIDKANSDASVSFSVKMDGKGLQIFLNETERDCKSLRDEVIAVLRLSSDPAKLVLDAMEGFYSPPSMEEEIEFKEDVVRKSCVLLLEQLHKISPEIKPHVKKEATVLALDWKRKMSADNRHSAEVSGFLLLLACYGLASEFDAVDLLHYLEIVAHDSQAPELFRVFGLAAHISSFVKKLISKRKLIEAFDLVYAFDLVSEFPPVPLLKDFLQSSKIAAKNARRKVKDVSELIEASRQRLNDLKAALKRIRDHNIVSDFSLVSLTHQILNVKMEISYMNTRLLAPICTAPSTQPDLRTQSSRNDAGAFTVSCDLNSSVSASQKVESTSIVCTGIKTLSHQQIGEKRPHCATAENFSVLWAEIPSKNVLAGSSGTEVQPLVFTKLEQPNGESLGLLLSEHDLLQQEKISADCRAEATPDIEPGEFIAPNFCPNPTTACASITDASQSSDFASIATHEQVAARSPSVTSVPTDILAPAGTVNLSRNTPICKLTFGSSALPTASATASNTVTPSSISSPASLASSKTQPQQQAQSKRRKVAESVGTHFKPRTSASTIVTQRNHHNINLH